MLLRYTVSNYKSIGHPIEFSMLPKPDEKDDRYLKTIQTKAGEWKVLRRGGFFGPNASGKTSFIDSIAYACNYIINARKSGRGTGVTQFKGTIEALHGNSTFQFVFYLEGDVYDYGFSIDRTQVYEEWLMQLGKKDFEALFRRTTDGNGQTSIEITSKLAQVNSKARTLAEVLKESIQEKQKNQLFLTKLSENGIKKAERIIGWFEDIQVIFPGSQFRALPIKMRENKDLESFIGEKLEKLDTGVIGAYIESKKVDFDEYAETMQLSEELVERIRETGTGIASFGDQYFIFSDGNSNKPTLVQLRLRHLLSQKEVKFDIDEESDGTRRLLDLLPMLFMTGHDNSIFFIDEIDRSLHTKLSQHLLADFAQRAENGNNQMIFTAHDINLINLHQFRQDEIWFIDKNKSGESKLRPLSDFSIQENTDTIKAYLSGRFGAVPVIKGDQ